ncbi:MAG: hypothetical protein WBM83_02475 [Flavobacteriaceae bacterium]
MILKNTLTVGLFAFILFVSCKADKKSEEKMDSSQMKQVMAIHDEVMPKMGKISKLVGELKAKVDTTEIGVQYEGAMTDLQEAHKGMMGWMQDFGDRFDSDEIMNGKQLSAEKQSWLDEEEAKIKVVREQINSSIKKAETLLEAN